MTCATCKRPIDPLDVFPKGNCLTCHAAIYDTIPVAELPQPDFLGAMGLTPPKKRRRRN